MEEKFMTKRRLVLLLIIFAIVIATSATVSAGLLNGNDSNIKTHEFNYANKAIFNISDDLTEKTGAESISFWNGVSYDYPKGNTVCYLEAIADYGGSDEVESNQNNAIFEEIDSNPTSQGYKTYIFKWDDLDEYDVYIDLNNLTINEDGFNQNYKYFKGTFASLDEAKVFIDTFKITES